MKLLPKLENSILHLYYLLILNYLYSAGVFWKAGNSSVQIPVDPHFLISFIPRDVYGITIQLFSIMAVVSVSILIINPWIRTFRIIALVSWLIYFAHESSFGKSLNDQYASTFTMLTFIFLPSSKNDQLKIDQVLVLAKFQAVMCYAMAGLWKVRAIPYLWESGEMMSNLGNAIAMEYMKYGRAGDISGISMFFMNRDYLTGPLFFCLVLLQTFSPLMVFNRKTQIFLGIMICIFHILSEVMLNISFRNNMYIMMVLFLYDPLIRSYIAHKKNDLQSRLSNL